MSDFLAVHRAGLEENFCRTKKAHLASYRSSTKCRSAAKCCYWIPQNFIQIISFNKKCQIQNLYVFCLACLRTFHCMSSTYSMYQMDTWQLCQSKLKIEYPELHIITSQLLSRLLCGVAYGKICWFLLRLLFLKHITSSIVKCSIKKEVLTLRR